MGRVNGSDLLWFLAEVSGMQKQTGGNDTGAAISLIPVSLCFPWVINRNTVRKSAIKPKRRLALQTQWPPSRLMTRLRIKVLLKKTAERTPNSRAGVQGFLCCWWCWSPVHRLLLYFPQLLYPRHPFKNVLFVAMSFGVIELFTLQFAR